MDYYTVDGPYAEDDLLTVFSTSPVNDGYFEILAASITNGVCELPNSQVPPYFAYNFWVQTVRSNGVNSAWTASNPEPFGTTNSACLPFLDDRRQLKDNLTFLLRAAGNNGAFAFTVNEGTEGWYLPPVFTWPTNYVYADFYDWTFIESQYSFAIDDLLPLHQNYFYRNFLFDSTKLDSDGFLNTGCTESNLVSITNYPTYYFNAASFIAATNPVVPSLFRSSRNVLFSELS